jgi:glutamyl-tRNA reductase
MINDFKILTITHRTLNVDEIGHFVIKCDNQTSLNQRLELLKEQFGIQEIMYLSTCNRVAYIIYGSELDDIDDLKDFFQTANPELSQDHLSKISKFVSVYNGVAAVNHLFELSSSIDSLVVGEREIFRQFRQSYDQCKKAGLTGDHLRILEKLTVQAAKEIYDKTKIGEKPLSIVSLAIQQFRALQLEKNARILIIGAGETNTLVGKFLKKYGYTNATVFNRSIDNAVKLTNLLGGEALHLSDLKSFDKGFDAMFVCTGATEAIINQELYKHLIKREEEEKVIVDLSVPRNVSETVVKNFSINYIDIEQLRLLAEENLSYRRAEIKVAKAILKQKIKDFESIYQQRQIEKALSNVSKEVKAVKNRAIYNVYEKQLATLDPGAKDLLLEMMDYMEKKFVSIPMRLAKESIK